MFKKIENIYYFIVGCLCILSAISHSLNGIHSSLPVINNANISTGIMVEFNYLWHIIGAENLIFGIILVIMAFYKKEKQSKIAIWLIISILSIRSIIIIICTNFIGDLNLSSIIIDSVVILLIICLLIIGLRKK